MCTRLLLLNTTTGNTFHYMLKALIVHNIKWIVAQNKSICIFQGSSLVWEKIPVLFVASLLCVFPLFTLIAKNDLAHVITLCVQLFYDVRVYKSFTIYLLLPNQLVSIP